MAVLGDMAKLFSKDEEKAPARGNRLDKEIEDRLVRGKQRADQVTPRRTEALEFWRGNHYAYINERNQLRYQPTTGSIRGGGKAPHRVRQARNLYLDAIEQEVASATKRVPSFDVVPTTTDPEDIAAARLAEKVALYGHSEWNFRRATLRAVRGAVIQEEAFAWAYWDPTIPPYVMDDDGNLVGFGDVCIEIYSGTQVYWEPGVKFEKSPWLAIDIAMTKQEIEGLEGYNGAKIVPDAGMRGWQGMDEANNTELTMVTYYLERPSPKNQEGSWLTIAHRREIAKGRPYPGDGKEPCLRKLCYFEDPESDRDRGLGPHLLDAQRTYNDANNKAIEWKNLILIPRVAVTPGLMGRQKLTDIPGQQLQISQPNENMRVIETPDVSRSLFEIQDRASGDIGRIAAQNQIPANIESGDAMEVLNERDENRHQPFIANLAEWYSEIMHDCLVLVQKYYTEPRLLKIKGRFGFETVQDFKGAMLKGQVDVRVSPASIEPRTRQAVEAKVLAYADRGWIDPVQAMAAIDGGYAEDFVRSYDLDVARAHRIVQKIEAGPEALLGGQEVVVGVNPPTMPDGLTPNPMAGMPIMAPTWMPRHADNIDIFMSVMEDWFKTEAYEKLDPPMQQAANEIYMQLQQLQIQKAMEQAAIEMQQAQDQGMQNASKPQVSTPDNRAVGQNGNNGLPTKNQPMDQSRIQPGRGRP